MDAFISKQRRIKRDRVPGSFGPTSVTVCVGCESFPVYVATTSGLRTGSVSGQDRLPFTILT